MPPMARQKFWAVFGTLFFPDGRVRLRLSPRSPSRILYLRLCLITFNAVVAYMSLNLQKMQVNTNSEVTGSAAPRNGGASEKRGTGLQQVSLRSDRRTG